MLRIILFSLSFALTSCSFFQSNLGVRKVEPGLSQSYAQLRGQYVSNPRYDLTFDLTHEKIFKGSVEISFLLKKSFPLSLDFYKGQITKLVVNGKQMSPKAYNQYFLPINASELKPGLNNIKVEFANEYSSNGLGLHRFVDPEDGRVYLYTQFESYFANRVFPCFDQPDLKATFRSRVKVPNEWQVISSTREANKQIEGENSLWIFPESQKFSTYLYSLHAGDYVVWEDEYKNGEQVVPLRLFARQTLKKYVKVEDWFDTTKKGFSFFEKYFSYEYPFKKYDQVIVPDFNAGAMENVAAVTFNEDRFVVRGEKTREQKRVLAHTLLHEMAHMWFGDLVTMKWWNDLWLNESFATFASTKALAEATDFNEAWLTFYSRTKQWAYGADQSVTTHPIVSEVLNTELAMSNFDGITYGKGASTLKQLSFYIGDKTFQKGLKAYFKDYAFQNTQLKDFVSSMERAAGLDLQTWKQRWLQTAMVNNLQAQAICHKGKITDFEIIQTATRDYPTLRPHKTKVAFFRQAGDKLKLNQSFDITYNRETTRVNKVRGKLCPHIIYPNYQDHDYAKVQLDPKTVDFLKDHLSNIDDDFLRTMLWADLWNMVRDQKLNLTIFLDIARDHGFAETNPNTLSFVFDKISIALKSYYPGDGTLWQKRRMEWVELFETGIYGMLSNSKEDVEAQRLWFRFLSQLAESPSMLDRFAKALQSNRVFPLEFSLNQDERWNLLSRLATYGHENAEALLLSERQKDQSKRGLNQTAYVQALLPSLTNKEALFVKVTKDRKTLSTGELRATLSGLFPENQKEIHKKFSERIYDQLKASSYSDEIMYMRGLVYSTLPQFCDLESTEQIDNFLQSQKSLPKYMQKAILTSKEENERCWRIQKLVRDKELG
ncbi:MAG: aminopeptidase N [Bdellovibrionales bacterium]|nr:aminopeptidase N [Bdellovibrionales bacterium]